MFLLDEVPRTGHAGCRIAFLDPAGTEGCLIELARLQRRATHAPRWGKGGYGGKPWCPSVP